MEKELFVSFCMAERAAKKQAFSREQAKAYLREFDSFIPQINDRAEKGTLTRAEDYVIREFSDPLYVSDYLNELREKWIGLCH